eukprot:12424098-Karenia_brevis.AAC.1
MMMMNLLAVMVMVNMMIKMTMTVTRMAALSCVGLQLRHLLGNVEFGTHYPSISSATKPPQ